MTVSIATGLQVGLDLLAAAQQISSMVQSAQAAGRDTLTQEEWAAIRRLDDEARAKAGAAIAALLAPAEPSAGSAGGAGEDPAGTAPGSSGSPEAAAGSEPVPPAP